MLENKFSYDLDVDDAYELDLPYCDNWKHTKHKILVIMQTVDGRDLKAGGLLGDKATLTCFKNVLKYTRGLAQAYKDNLPHAAYAVINFNAKRHLHLGSSARASMESEFAARVHKIIAKLKPTHILVSGERTMAKLFPAIENPVPKNGWVHELKVGSLDVKVTSTLDYNKLLEKKGERANLLGFFCRHFRNLHLGYIPHSVADIKLKKVYIKTRDQFDQLYERLKKGTVIAVDTETKDLSVLHNTIYMIQFAFDEDPETGYVLTLNHPMTHWSKDDLKYIFPRLKKFFSSRTNIKELVFQNGMFDLRVIRRYFKIPIIWHKVWEISSGEHSLDENINELPAYGIKGGGLAAIFCSWGNDFYFDKNNKFSKGERNTVGSVPPNDPELLKYAAMDAVCLINIRRSQIAASGYQEIDGRKYKPYYVRHMLHQMSDTAHQLSHLREDGSLVDAKYLKFLTSHESPIRAEMKELVNSLKAYPEAQEANKQILADSGMKSKGLFGSAVASWALSFSKPDHLRTLFFNVLGLAPVSETKQGTPSVDKDMIAAYKDTNPIVADYGDYTKLSKLLSTYAKGWYKKLISNNDSITDSHLRPDYSSFDVSTGRLASKNPSLQTIPSRGKLVKIIKRMFIAPKGYLLIRFDYSAHEVRVWSIASGDKVLAAVFKVGQQLRQMFIQTPSIPQADIEFKALLDEWFTYHPDTGDFTWKKSNGTSNPAGKKAGSPRGTDGFYLNLHGKVYRANRCAFLMTYGYLPEEVDHKDNDIYNNKISNLRPATRLENSRNRRADSTKTSSSYKGVYPGPKAGTWVAQIKPKPGVKQKHLGVFSSQEEAHAAYVKAAKKYHKEFANAGNRSISNAVEDYRHPSVIAKEDIKKRGDIHILNVKRILGKDVDKEHPLRDAIKSIIFGLLYGKSAETLGVDTKTGDILELKEKIKALTAKIAELEK